MSGYEEGTYNVDSKGWFKAWNHWLNPLGNWHEPMPYPLKRQLEAPDNEFLAWLWWTARNPFHNFTHFVLGICPVGRRYDWVSPETNGWYEDTQDFCWRNWKPRRPVLCRKHFRVLGFKGYIGWSDRGSFGISLRRG